MASKKTPLAIQSGFPGQLGLLSQQMNEGFGGGLLAQRNYLDRVYSPSDPRKVLNLGDDAKTDTPGGDGSVTPGMERWAKLLYADPNMEQKLAELEKGFRLAGYLK